jgi:hypothetical protein
LHTQTIESGNTDIFSLLIYCTHSKENSREKEPGQLSPLAYDYVPTTEVYDRLDEVYRIDFDWQEKMYTGTSSIDLPISALKKSVDRIRIWHNDRSTEGIEYHLYFWNSTLTLLKPQCKSLRLNSKEIWSDKKQVRSLQGYSYISSDTVLIRGWLPKALCISI